MERLAVLECDLVLVSAMTRAGSSADPFAPLSAAGIRVVYIPTSESLSGIRADVTQIAELTETQEEGSKLIASMDSEIERIRAITGAIPADQRRSVYFELSPAPDLYSFGSGTYLDELLSLAGAENILKTEKGWIAVSAEVVAARNPEVILTNVDWIADPAGEIKSRSGWAGITAIREGRVYRLDSRSTSRPAPLSAQRALAEIAEEVYPEYLAQ
jgi:iron complex transport system substrate-binding protein